MTAMGATRRTFVQRALGAALLDPKVYEEVEADRGANGQAACVVVLSSVAAGIGSIANQGWGGVVWYTAAAADSATTQAACPLALRSASTSS